MRIRTLPLATVALTATLLLAGCSASTDDGMPGMDHGTTSDSPSSSAAPDANAADEMFVQMMIPHHEQAIEMSDLILGKDGIDARVIELAQQIKDAQGPEIDTMTGWLKDWGVASGTAHHMADDGMMSAEDMAVLDAATGTESARLFLDGMIAHHEGAISMAEAEIANGQNPDVTGLAQRVIDGQGAEITTMKNILDSL